MFSARAVLLKTLLLSGLYSQLEATMSAAIYNTGPPGDFLTLINIAAKSGSMNADLAYAIFKKVTYAVNNEAPATFASDVTNALPILKDIDTDGLFTPLVYQALQEISTQGTNTNAIKTTITKYRDLGAKRTGFDQTYDALLADQKKAVASTDELTYDDAHDILKLLYRAARIVREYPRFKYLIQLGKTQFDGLPGIPAKTVATAYDNIAKIGDNRGAARNFAKASLQTLEKYSLQYKSYEDLSDAFTAAEKNGTLNFQAALDILNKIIAAASGPDKNQFLKILIDAQTQLSKITGTPALTLLNFINQIISARTSNKDADLESILAEFLKTLKSQADASQSYVNLANTLNTVSQLRSISLPVAVNILTFLGQAASGKDYTMFSKALSEAGPKLEGVTGIPTVFIREVFANLTRLGNNFPAITDNITTSQTTLTAYQMGILKDYLMFIASVATDADPDIAKYVDMLFSPLLGNLGGTSSLPSSNTGA